MQLPKQSEHIAYVMAMILVLQQVDPADEARVALALIDARFSPREILMFSKAAIEIAKTGHGNYRTSEMRGARNPTDVEPWPV